MSCGRCAAACRWSSRTRPPRSTRASRSAPRCWRRSRCTTSARAPAARRLVGETLELVGLNADVHGALSAPALGRAAPARGDRAGDHPAAVAGPGRRADLGARRLGAGADPESVQADAARARPHLRVRQPQSRRDPLHQRPGRRDASRPDRRERAERDRSSRVRSTSYTRALLDAVPDPDPARVRERRIAQAVAR